MSIKNTFSELTEAVQQELDQVVSEIDPDVVHRFVGDLIKANRIFIAGKGRTGLQMQSFAMRLMHLGLTVFVVGDVTSPGIEEGDLLVFGTASGKTPSLASYAETAAKLGVRINSITSTHVNTISKLSDVNIIIPAPSHKNAEDIQTLQSIQPLGGLFELALGLLLNVLVLQLMEIIEVNESEMIQRHANLE
jgi:6-phospho-3-hexuloisomerase